MTPIFAAVLGPADRLRSLLIEGPTRVRETMTEDELIKGVHWLYVGDTPLHLAAAAVRPDAVEALLAAGADPRAANRRRAQPLHYACDPRPNNAGWDPQSQAAAIAALVRGGADVNAVDMDGVTPLHRAVRARSPAAVRALIERGANVRARSKRGSTPFDLTRNSTGAGGASGAAQACAEIAALLKAAGA